MRRNQSEPEQGSYLLAAWVLSPEQLEEFLRFMKPTTFGEHVMPDFADTPNTGTNTPASTGSNDLSPTPLASALTPENTAPTDLVEETAKTNAELAAEEERKATPGPVDNEYAPSPAEAGLVVATHDRDSVQPPAPASYYAPEAKLKEDK
jgi:hypothetical protein